MPAPACCIACVRPHARNFTWRPTCAHCDWVWELIAGLECGCCCCCACMLVIYVPSKSQIQIIGPCPEISRAPSRPKSRRVIASSIFLVLNPIYIRLFCLFLLSLVPLSHIVYSPFAHLLQLPLWLLNIQLAFHLQLLMLSHMPFGLSNYSIDVYSLAVTAILFCLFPRLVPHHSVCNTWWRNGWARAVTGSSVTRATPSCR